MPLYVRTLLVTASPEQVREAARGHLDHLRRLRSEGRLRAAGEFRNGDGYFEIFEAADLLEADATAHASPLVSDGLATWMLREWIELDLG